MKAIEVTEQNFDHTVREGLVLLDFWASWCGPCRAFAPVFEAAAARHPGVTFGKVNTQTEAHLAARFRIRSIPTLVVFRDGIALAAVPGALPAGHLDQLIQTAEELDMDQVRRELAAERAPARGVA